MEILDSSKLMQCNINILFQACNQYIFINFLAEFNHTWKIISFSNYSALLPDQNICIGFPADLNQSEKGRRFYHSFISFKLSESLFCAKLLTITFTIGHQITYRITLFGPAPSLTSQNVIVEMYVRACRVRYIWIFWFWAEKRPTEDVQCAGDRG